MMLDEEGYLVDPGEWNEAIAEAHRNDLFRLFPYGYVKQACKLAGMRRPRAWSTG